MSEAKRALVQAWLTKAANDLGSAKKLARGPDLYLDTAVYHCQQVGEKALKAFLVFGDVTFEKTHDLQVLIEEAAVIQPEFLSYSSEAALLTPHATGFRYPSDLAEPTAGEVDEAIDAATRLYEFVLSQLPSEVHPARS